MFRHQSHSRHRSWIGYLVAPLFLISLALHGLLLVFPLPSGSEDASEDPAELPESSTEEEAVDLLSISSLATETPELPPEPAPETPPAPAALPSPASRPQAVPKASEETPRPTPSPLDEPQNFAAEPETEPPAAGFDPARQQQLVGSAAGAIGRAPGKSNFDVTEAFPGNAWEVPGWRTDISRWSAQKRSCFFRSIDASRYQLIDGAQDLRYLSRNLGLVVSDDLPRTFPNQTIQALEGGYCDERLYQVSENGSPVLWISIIGIGDGDPSATAAVVFWSQDPRG